MASAAVKPPGTFAVWRLDFLLPMSPALSGYLPLKLLFALEPICIRTEQPVRMPRGQEMDFFSMSSRKILNLTGHMILYHACAKLAYDQPHPVPLRLKGVACTAIDRAIIILNLYETVQITLSYLLLYSRYSTATFTYFTTKLISFHILL